MFATLTAVLPTWLFGAARTGDGTSRGGGTRDVSIVRTHAMPSDPLLERLHRDDPSALEEAHTLYAAELWRHAYRYVSDRDAAEDIVQDVFVAFWHRRHELSTELAIRPYLFAAVRNHALKHIRHHAVVARAQQTSDIAVEQSVSHVTESVAIESSLDALVRQALVALPERQRTAIELRWLRGLTYTESAYLGSIRSCGPKTRQQAILRLETLHHRLREPGLEVDFNEVNQSQYNPYITAGCTSR